MSGGFKDPDDFDVLYDDDLMGEHARDARDFELRQREVPPPSLAEKYGFWRTRDGRVIEIAKMADKHIESAIALFTRAGWGDHSKIQELRSERKRRGK